MTRKMAVVAVCTQKPEADKSLVSSLEQRGSGLFLLCSHLCSEHAGTKNLADSNDISFAFIQCINYTYNVFHSHLIL